MANFKYRWAEQCMRLGNIPGSTTFGNANAALGVVGSSIKALLVMTNTTCHLDLGARTITGVNGFGTLDEVTVSGYARQSMVSRTLTEDTTLNDYYLSAPGINFGTSAGTPARLVKGALIYFDLGGDGANIPLLWIDSVDSGQTFPASYTSGLTIRLTPNNNIWARFR